MENTSPLYTAYNRLDEVHRAWHIALKGYHHIEDFRAGVNSAIQSLRNLTFALQKQKDNLPDFESWYSQWQTKMRNDPILKELHEARNMIVKEEDLKLHSVATARTKGWVEYEKMAFTFDPLKNSYDVAKGFYDTYARHLPVDEQLKKRLVFEFERKWVYEKLPDEELLTALAHAYNFFDKMLQEASEKFSLSKRVNNPISYCSNELNDQGKLKCMIISSQERSLVLSFENGKVLEMQTRRILRNEADFKKVHKKYGDKWRSKETVSLLEGLFPEEYPFNQMKLFAQVAVSNLQKDKYLVPTSFIFTEKQEPPIIIAHPFQNQEQKMLGIDKVATSILKNNGKFVLTVAEVWLYDFDGANTIIPSYKNTRGARDVLQFTCLSAKKVKVITIPFHKNIFRKIVFSQPKVEDFSSEDHRYLIFLPLMKSLKEVERSS